MPVIHDWRPFDVIRGYDVRWVTRVYFEVRNAEGRVWHLTRDEFDQLRRPGPNPQDIP